MEPPLQIHFACSRSDWSAREPPAVMAISVVPGQRIHHFEKTIVNSNSAAGQPISEK